MSIALACGRLTKSFGSAPALRALDLQLKEGVIYALLGRNGAGKTTLLNTIAGGIAADSGTIEVGGQRLRRGELPKDLCYVRDHYRHFGGARVIEALQIAAAFYPRWDWSYALELLDLFLIDKDQKIRQLSSGNQSLIQNVIGLASRAQLTLYDEPVLSLDVLMRERFYKALMEDYANYPRTILVSTHLIDEIAPVAERIIILESGALLLQDDMEQCQQSAYLIRGNSEAVASYTSGKRVIYREDYGRGTLAALYEKLSDTDKRLARERNISIEALSLQKLFLYLIEGGL
ncbi:ABC transporter ATP-binding protein [Paenibacillus sp. FSL H3-0333]|uniref:ABC transporter ATP-binding protein n=1 Tax=Paenibacillus sp. FSL H3-0333 TaxID=2921373 RepID=UPI0030F639BE